MPTRSLLSPRTHVPRCRNATRRLLRARDVARGREPPEENCGKDAKTVKHDGSTQRLARAASGVRNGKIQRSSDSGPVDTRGQICTSITRRKITDTDRAEAIRLFHAGTYVKDIASSLRVTKASVRKILYEAGVAAPPRRMTEAEIKDAARRYENGESLVRLGERFGCSPGTVRSKIVRAGVEMRPSSVPRSL
ncbi:MAG TPA: hypothetical protein DCX61_01195 [Gemmatimonadetes bacterium]|nr:hypothetical protein [Gemmatimonadota bacterium]